MNTTADRSTYIAHLADRYSTELAHLRDSGLTPEITWNGHEYAITANLSDNRYLRAVNGDGCIVGPNEESFDMNAQDWSIGIHTGNDEEGDYKIAEGENADFATAYAETLDSLERGDFDE